MATYIVTYDLNREVSRPPIVAEIKKFPWAKLSESSYAISTLLSPKEVYDRLSGMLDGNDALFVITLNRPWWGQGPKDVRGWLTDNL
jgi:hypothetical protein